MVLTVKNIRNTQSSEISHKFSSTHKKNPTGKSNSQKQQIKDISNWNEQINEAILAKPLGIGAEMKAYAIPQSNLVVLFPKQMDFNDLPRNLTFYPLNNNKINQVKHLLNNIGIPHGYLKGQGIADPKIMIQENMTGTKLYKEYLPQMLNFLGMDKTGKVTQGPQNQYAVNFQTLPLRSRTKGYPKVYLEHLRNGTWSKLPKEYGYVTDRLTQEKARIFLAHWDALSKAYIKSTQKISNMPQEHIDLAATTIKAIHNAGLEFDFQHNGNFLYNKAKGPQFIDLGFHQNSSANASFYFERWAEQQLFGHKSVTNLDNLYQIISEDPRYKNTLEKSASKLIPKIQIAAKKANLEFNPAEFKEYLTKWES